MHPFGAVAYMLIEPRYRLRRHSDVAERCYHLCNGAFNYFAHPGVGVPRENVLLRTNGQVALSGKTVSHGGCGGSGGCGGGDEHSSAPPTPFIPPHDLRAEFSSFTHLCAKHASGKSIKKISDPRPTPKAATSASATAHNSPFARAATCPPKAPKANKKSASAQRGSNL